MPLIDFDLQSKIDFPKKRTRRRGVIHDSHGTKYTHTYAYFLSQCVINSIISSFLAVFIARGKNLSKNESFYFSFPHTAFSLSPPPLSLSLFCSLCFLSSCKKKRDAKMVNMYTHTHIKTTNYFK